MARPKKDNTILFAFLHGMTAFVEYLHSHMDRRDDDPNLTRVLYYSFASNITNDSFLTEHKLPPPVDFEKLPPAQRNFWRDVTRTLLICMGHEQWDGYSGPHKYAAWMKKFVHAKDGQARLAMMREAHDIAMKRDDKKYSEKGRLGDK